MRPPLDQQVTFLYADDAEACWRFYEEMLELPLVQDQGSVRIYSLDGSRAFLGVCRARGPRASEDPRVVGGVVFTLVSRDVEGWHAFLAAKGVTLPMAPTYSEAYRITHFFFKDPAGYTIEIQRFERPDWPAI
ncbi:VOC family protein [Sediminicoccus sp. KRV36]|uniref:VOC family protein n=1 Tax=Sediminicoccus sp. KRV36 TaxID=3133721 RepID=UPI00200D7EA3|nr:VOC family protein [Sediminicoccus rosea]UPY37913.1 VOC family protein [Sediminicoccus rosea]